MTSVKSTREMKCPSTWPRTRGELYPCGCAHTGACSQPPTLTRVHPQNGRSESTAGPLGAACEGGDSAGTGDVCH